MYKVGLVEDEEALNKLIKNYLEKEDFIVETFTKGQDALDFINDKNNVNLWILDIMLADDVTGYDIIKAIRLQDEEVPIIFSSARDQSIDKIMGLELGCDDYIAKPYSPKELVLRVKNIIKSPKLEYTILGGFLYVKNDRFTISFKCFGALLFNKDIRITLSNFI